MPDTEPPVIERRRSPRKSDRIKALVGPRKASSDSCENALIEEIGKNGLRIVSGAPLREEDSFVIYVNGESRPLEAKVIWVRKQGLIEKRATGKAGQAFVAGVKLRRKESEEKPERKRGAAKRADQKALTDMQTRVVRGIFIGGGIVILGVVVYAVVSLINMMG